MNDSSDLARELGAALGEGYAVERTLGEGGFAVVFLVRDLALKRNLAVKVLSPDLIVSKTVLERFRREAETVAQLSHPNIVPLYFIGQRDDLLYLAMQCVEGGSVAERLKREGTLPVADVVRIISEVASALAHAHKRGVIHRDIKPANVLVDPESGRCLVTDFGIARSADAAHLTASGMMLGTPAYLSPEQVTGQPMDARVDIYALGVMAYEMLTGRVPFEGATAAGGMMMRLAGPPTSVTTLRPDVPREVAAAVTACLAVDPNDRPRSADEVIRAFGGESITTGGRRTLTAPVLRRQRKARWIVGALGLIVFGGGGFLLKGRGAAVAPISAPALGDADLVNIPSGSYVIGTDDGDASGYAQPRHSERVDSFQIERTEVTVAAYQAFAAATHAPTPWAADSVPVGNLPITKVAWGDAANYCAWKYPKVGRLPTEIEWEAAARGVTGRIYPHGNTVDAASANTASARRNAVTPVGSFPRSATPEGVQDMSGNVWEWTSSPLRAYPGGAALPDSMATHRVIRGGAFDTSDSLATTWMRGYLKVAAAKTGFRCVKG